MVMCVTREGHILTDVPRILEVVGMLMGMTIVHAKPFDLWSDFLYINW